MKLRLPALNPALPLARQAKRVLRSIQRRVNDRLRGETATTYFDLTNAAEVNAELTAYGVDVLAIDPREAEDGTAGAARFILANLVCNPALRRHYPQALHDGAAGQFAAYLQEGLSANAAANVAACFAAPPGEPLHRVYEMRSDLRTIYPLALTPVQRRQYLAWLLVHGRPDLGITAEGALWHLIELDETPDRGLIPTYLLQPEWQAQVPHALTAFGWPEFCGFLKARYGLTGRWIQRATWRPTMRPWDELLLCRQMWPELFRDLPDSPKPVPTWLRRNFGIRHLPGSWIEDLKADFAAKLPAQRGVNVLGHFRYASGLQEAAFGIVKALEQQGVRVGQRDLPVLFKSDWRDRNRYRDLEVHDTTIYVAAANTYPKTFFPVAGLRMRPGVRRIAVWYWELDRLPDEWRPELAWADEVWAPTRFMAGAFRHAVSVPVVPMLPGVALPAFNRKPREYFNLPADRFLALFSFDMGSVMERKNPLGLVEAFRRAFRSDDRAHLCIKVSRGESDPGNLARLREACRSVGATLLECVLPREDALALLATADCYASLHRAEGLGLGLAESMLLGTPVIGTNYSGNLDFMTESNSFLVNAGMTTIQDSPPYPDGFAWADPDLDHAAARLRQIYDDRDGAKAIAMRGQREVAEALSVEAAGRRMTERLKCLDSAADASAKRR